MNDVAQKLGGALVGGEVNVGTVERWASMFGGGYLAGAGIKKGGAGGALMGLVGAILLHRGATGHCNVYTALGVDTSSTGARPADGAMPATGAAAGVRLEASITVNRMAEELYAYWRDFTNAPSYMDRIISVRALDDRRSLWTAEGPRGAAIEWMSDLTEDVPNRRIAWHSLPGSDLPNRGSVEFTPGRLGETTVRHTLEFDPPGGMVGEAIARVMQGMTKEMVQADLRRFKTLMEAGTTVGAGAPAGSSA
ncbi:MAG TPA: SRPBCC family protein [Longimicrobium sp.]|uniref:SRPBCC family protein n=1 Tax=Longimicrobium sp. TaxID=2029185 RepID=UPI002EDA1711